MRPTIGVVIATPGRRSILRTMYSILMQGLEPGDDVIIVGDGHHQPTADLVTMMGPPFRYVATTRTRDWGHSQVNYGIEHVKGDYVVIQDDDDIFLPRAFDEMRLIISKLESPRPIIGRVKTPYLGILWTGPRVEPLDGHCLVIPNDKKKLGYFGLEYAGDQKWLATNIDAYEVYSWADRVWTLTRPTWKMWALQRQPNVWVFYRDEGGAPSAVAEAWLQLKIEDEHVRVFCNVLNPKGLSSEECCELAEFASWAGQGNDTWFEFNENQNMIHALNTMGYQFHQELYPKRLEFTHDWPPHTFYSPEELKEKIKELSQEG